jgi:hypothetical protein
MKKRKTVSVDYVFRRVKDNSLVRKVTISYPEDSPEGRKAIAYVARINRRPSGKTTQVAQNEAVIEDLATLADWTAPKANGTPFYPEYIKQRALANDKDFFERLGRAIYEGRGGAKRKLKLFLLENWDSLQGTNGQAGLKDFTDEAERLLESLALRLDIELINGSGLGNHLLGILSSSPTVLSKGALSRNDALITAISRVRSIGGGQADLIIANPADVLLWKTDKASTGGNYQAGYPAQFSDVSKPVYRFEECDVVQTTAIATGNVLVLDTRGGILFPRRQGIIETSPTDGSNFVNNLLTLRASLRAVFLYHSPSRAVSITGF